MTAPARHDASLAGRRPLGLSPLLAAGMAIGLTFVMGSPLSAQEPEEAAEARAAGPQPIETHPFPTRLRVPEFPRDAEWLNVGGPLRLKDLRGKFVLLDFWTYCCINCIHILPELKKLERAYAGELVVVGVHSAKFEAERGARNIEEAILRYEIEHPVVNDPDHRIWRSFFVRSWPTVYLIDPTGQLVWGKRGEVRFEEIDAVLRRGLPYYRGQKLLDSTPLRFDLLAAKQPPTPLRFPGKLLADAPGDRLFIADSNHNRIVITTLAGRLRRIIGSGKVGRQDGGFEDATFDHPQGMALDGETLYVADTENHLLRQVDLAAETVTTIAGTGRQARGGWPGLEQLGPDAVLPERWVGTPRETSLNSPWDVWVHGDDLYLAMAGPHQIWRMGLDQREIGPFAGNGREDIVDGPLLPAQPYALGFSSFAQPSGLSSDGEWLFVADCEGSSIRAVPFDTGRQVRTVVGTADLPASRLFRFGDRDGARDDVLLQHALGVCHWEGNLYVADTYNNKIKVVAAATGDTRTLSGTGEPGHSDSPAQYDEPAGISQAHGLLYIADTNNHRVRTLEIATGRVETLEIPGLAPPAATRPPQPDFSAAVVHRLDPSLVRRVDGKIRLRLRVQLPSQWKLSPLSRPECWIRAVEPTGPLVRSALGKQTPRAESGTLWVELPAAPGGSDHLEVSVQYDYCQEGSEGLCRMGQVTWDLPLRIRADGEQAVTLVHDVQAPSLLSPIDQEADLP